MFCQTKPCFGLELDSEIPSPKNIVKKKKKVAEFIVDETIVKAGSEYVWLWVAIEPKDKAILALNVSKERNMFVAERFVAGLVKAHGKHAALVKLKNALTCQILHSCCGPYN